MTDGFTRGAEVGLDHMRRLMASLGDPHLSYPVVHVTGTNGKTSTARMVAALLGTHGLRVGLTTSPHLASPLERMAVGGVPVGPEVFAELTSRVAARGSSGGDGRAGYFEALTAAALVWFAELGVEVAVVEVGVGGRFDATNVVRSEVAVITNIGLDHTEMLGPTRAHVAADKAGIVKAGSTLVLGEADPELAATFDATPATQVYKLGRDFDCVSNRVLPSGRSLTLRTPGARYREVALALHGAYQGINAACALAAAEALVGAPLSEETVRSALERVTSPGRMEVLRVRPWLILDGAKNSAGAAAAAAATREEFAGAEARILVVGMLAGRDARHPAQMLAALDARSARLVVACAPAEVRALPAEEVAAAARSLGVPTVAAASVGAAVDIALARANPGDLVLVTGSLYVVAEARTHLVGPGPAA